MKEKPLEIKYMEFKKNLASLINESGIPPFIITEILNDMLSQTRLIAEQIYENVKNEYESPHNTEDEKCRDTINKPLD